MVSDSSNVHKVTKYVVVSVSDPSVPVVSDVFSYDVCPLAGPLLMAQPLPILSILILAFIDSREREVK